jgi:UDP-N-acetyl-2-amino-2-deoxyglucuronate dehydrogenase
LSSKLRFGILGCGVIGPFHARAIGALPDDAELVAVADHHSDRAAKLAQEYGAAWYDNIQSLLAHPGLDVVCICTPSGRHTEHAIAALHAGKHVVVEKPVDITLSAIDRLLAVQRASDCKVTVISQHRFDPATRAVADAVQSGRFGRLTVGTAQVRWWRSQGYYDSGKWRGTWALDGGGALMNQSIHTIDLLLSVMGKAVEASAYTALLAHERIEVEDTAVAILRFANGALGVVEGTTAAYPGLTARLEIHGERGSAIIDNDQLVYFHAATSEHEGAAYGSSGEGNQAAAVLSRYNVEPASPTAGADPGSLSMAHRDQLQDFIAAVRAGREPQVTIEEGRKAVAAILAIYESARAGRPELIDDRSA